MQTNASLLNDELAAHLAEYKFLVGVSIDGPGPIHDRYRRSSRERSSHADVLQEIEILKNHKVEFNALVLVSSANVKRPREIYDYLCGLGINFHQYIPCVEFDARGRKLPYTISGAELKAEWNDLCSICPYLEFCCGDCLKHHLYNGNPPQTVSWLCAGWREFYQHSIPLF